MLEPIPETYPLLLVLALLILVKLPKESFHIGNDTSPKEYTILGASIGMLVVWLDILLRGYVVLLLRCP